MFNTLTGLHVPVGFGGEVRLGTVKVPDERIGALSKIFSPKKTTYAEIVFCDIPGEHGAEKKGLSSKALLQIRDQEVVCLVLRAFPNPALESDPDPIADLEHVAVDHPRRPTVAKSDPHAGHELGHRERLCDVASAGPARRPSLEGRG